MAKAGRHCGTGRLAIFCLWHQATCQPHQRRQQPLLVPHRSVVPKMHVSRDADALSTSLLSHLCLLSPRNRTICLMAACSMYSGEMRVHFCLFVSGSSPSRAALSWREGSLTEWLVICVFAVDAPLPFLLYSALQAGPRPPLTLWALMACRRLLLETSSMEALPAPPLCHATPL